MAAPNACAVRNTVRKDRMAHRTIWKKCFGRMAVRFHPQAGQELLALEQAAGADEFPLGRGMTDLHALGVRVDDPGNLSAAGEGSWRRLLAGAYLPVPPQW